MFFKDIGLDVEPPPGGKSWHISLVIWSLYEITFCGRALPFKMTWEFETENYDQSNEKNVIL